jgi:hypothetical protein
MAQLPAATATATAEGVCLRGEQAWQREARQRRREPIPPNAPSVIRRCRCRRRRRSWCQCSHPLLPLLRWCIPPRRRHVHVATCHTHTTNAALLALLQRQWRHQPQAASRQPSWLLPRVGRPQRRVPQCVRALLPLRGGNNRNGATTPSRFDERVRGRPVQC